MWQARYLITIYSVCCVSHYLKSHCFIRCVSWQFCTASTPLRRQHVSAPFPGFVEWSLTSVQPCHNSASTTWWFWIYTRKKWTRSSTWTFPPWWMNLYLLMNSVEWSLHRVNSNCQCCINVCLLHGVRIVTVFYWTHYCLIKWNKWLRND